MSGNLTLKFWGQEWRILEFDGDTQQFTLASIPTNASPVQVVNTREQILQYDISEESKDILNVLVVMLNKRPAFWKKELSISYDGKVQIIATNDKSTEKLVFVVRKLR